MRLAVGVIAILFVLGMVDRSVQEGVPAAPAPATASANCSEEDALLVPCVGYLQGSASSPSDGCCAGLSVVLRKNYICLCQLIVQGASVSTSQGGFNLTDALALPSACHTNADPDKCKDYPGFPNIGGTSPIASQPSLPPNVGGKSPTASQPAVPPGSAVQGAPSLPPHHPPLPPSSINSNSSSSNPPSSPTNAAATIHDSAARLGLFYSTVVGISFHLLL